MGFNNGPRTTDNAPGLTKMKQLIATMFVCFIPSGEFCRKLLFEPQNIEQGIQNVEGYENFCGCLFLVRYSKTMNLKPFKACVLKNS